MNATQAPHRPGPARRPLIRAAAAVSGLLATMTTGAQTPPAAPPASPSTVTASDDTQVVTVTASKRRERAQDVPAALLVIGAPALERLGIEKLADYSTLVPNVAVGSAAGSGLGALILRGMYTGVQQQTATTVIYLGETPFTASGGLSLSALTTPDPDLVDVDRIEVLKGPQATLYGAGSLGGLIRITPRRADLSVLSGRVSLGASKVTDGSNGHGVRASLNVPLLTDKLALLVNVFDRTDAGFTRNITTGRDNLGQTKSQGGSASLRFKPTSAMDVNLRLMTQKADTHGVMGQDNLVGTGTPAYGQRQYAATFDRGVATKYGLGELTADYGLSNGMLTVSLSKASIKVGIFEDYTAAYAPLVALITDARTVFGAPLNTPPFIPYSVRGDVTPSVDKTSFELRFASKRLGAIEYLTGLYATRERNHYATHNFQFDNAGTLYTGQVLGFDPSSPTFTRLFERGVLAYADLYSTYREMALFGNATVYLDNDVDATVGLRRATNEQSANVVSPALGVGFINIGSYSSNSSDSATTFQATVRYRPDANTSTFARVASGYRPGGTQATQVTPPTYAPDKVVNYEAGIKGRVGDVLYDASIYHADWNKVQLNSLDNGVPVLRNGGKARIDGFEAQVVYQPRGGLSIGGSFGYNRSRITALDAATAAATGARVGDPLPNSPKITAALFGDHRFKFGGLDSSVGLTLKHSGEKPANYSADLLNVPYTVPAFTTLDLRASVLWARCTLRIGIDNVGDINGISGYTTLQVLPGTVQTSTVWLIRPRTFTANMSYEF